MNEELQIRIRAITADAQRNLRAVREELADIGDTSQEASAELREYSQSVVKSVNRAVAAITTLITFVNTLKSSLNFQKEQAKLVASFQAVGSTGKQAQETYKNIFRFLGESDRAVEAAQNLSKLTTEEKALEEWTNILQGAYASFGDSLPIEGLAEAANETVKVGKVSGSVADALNWMGVSEDAFNAQLEATTSLEEREVLLRSTLNSLYNGAASIYERNNQALIKYNESQVKLDNALAQATRYVVPLMTELNELAAVILQVLTPAFETISAVIIVFVQWIVAAIQFIGSFFGLFGEEGAKASEAINTNIQTVQQSAAGATSGINGMGGAMNAAVRAAKELKKQTMGFDELNILKDMSVDTGATGGGSGGGAGGSGGGISVPSIGEMDLMPSGLKDFQEKVGEIEEKMKSIAVLAGIAAVGFAAWKLAQHLPALQKILSYLNLSQYTYQQIMATAMKSQIMNKLKNLGGSLMIVSGVILLIQGYSDAWVNGIDWANFATILGGIALVVGGLALAVSPLAAAIALVVGGIASLVLGIKDIIENGATAQNILLIIAGAIATIVGVVWALTSAGVALSAAFWWITLIVVVIVAIVAAFIYLWNNCEGFRDFWIDLWDKVKAAAVQFWETLQPLFEAIWGAIQELWALIQAVWAQIKPYLMEAWEEIKRVWEAAKPYFEWLWEAIKVIFMAAINYICEAFKGSWALIKAVWDVAVGYFTTLWNSIKLVFSVVKNVLSGNWKDAWEGIKAIVGTWAQYFVRVWENIKKVFAAVGEFFGNVFGEAWEKVKKTFTKIGTAIADAVTGVVKAAINNVLSGAAKIINGFIKAINVAISVLNAIPGVNINKLSELTVPQLATGGIIESATLAVVGERGKEAVLPLENNTGWMDVLADRIAARNETPSKIVLTVDGKELGYATIGSINNITRQSGKLQLALM